MLLSVLACFRWVVVVVRCCQCVLLGGAAGFCVSFASAYNMACSDLGVVLFLCLGSEVPLLCSNVSGECGRNGFSHLAIP